MWDGGRIEFAISTTMVVFILGLPRTGHPARLIRGRLSWRSFSASFFFFSREASKQATRGFSSFYNGSWTWSIAASCFTRADDARRITMVLGPAFACANQLLFILVKKPCLLHVMSDLS